jgi:hypothetical protein
MRVIPGLSVVVVSAVALWVVFPHGNPGGLSDAKYSQFKRAAPPKLVYSCVRKPTRTSFLREEKACLKTGRASCDEKVKELIEAGTETEVDFVAGSETSTYDTLLQEASRECSRIHENTEPGEIKVLEADKN